MATRTYTVGDKSGVRRLDNLTGPWVDIPLNLLDCTGTPILDQLYDVMVDPNDENKVLVSGWRQANECRPGIYWSNDAGVTWNKAVGDIAGTLNETYAIFELWIVDSNVIYATSNCGYVFKSTDGGVTFNHTTTNPGDVNPAPGWFAGNCEIISKAIHFVDANNGIVCMGIGGFEFACITTDGGASWTFTDLQTFGVMNPAVGVHMSADFQTINVLARTGIWRSTDGGTTFAQVYSVGADPFLYLLHLTWTDDDNLWAYGLQGLRVRSTDGGATWVVINTASAGGPAQYAGHHFQLPDGFFSQDQDIFRTTDESVTGFISETSPYGVQAVWTSVPGPIDPPNPPPCGCPEGYTYNPATDECDQTIIVSPDCSNTLLPVIKAAANPQYGQMGTNFYASTVGAALPLTSQSGTPWAPGIAPANIGGAIFDANSVPLPYTNINAVTNNFWGNCNLFNNPYQNPNANPPTNLVPCSGLGNSGRLNAVGVWASTSNPATPIEEWIGFTTCVNVPETGIYFIGIGSDESSRFKIDGVLFTNLFPGSFDEWSVWRVFPVELTAGQHIIEMEGRNDSQFGGFGAEIYKVPNDDVNLLMAVTSEQELAPYVIWSTLEVVGEVFDLGENSGCECPDGFALSNCDGGLQCIQVNSIPFQPCGCYLLTNCEDPEDTVLIQTDPLDPPLDLTKIYVFNSIDPDKCWTVSESEDCDPANPLPFSTFDAEFDNCEDCTRTCYELVDCEGVLNPIQTGTDLSAVVGQVIKIINCPDTCWTVNELPDCPVDTVDVNVIADFPNCTTCLPQDPPPPPLVVRNRPVKPGYDTPGCSPEYVEKINCDWSEALFQQSASKRYGIAFCCELDLQKLDIKKQMLDFKMITDPEACKTIVEPECCPPCNVEAMIHVFGTISCDAPTNVDAVLDVPNPVVQPNCIDVTLTAKGHPGISYPVTGTDCCGNPIDIRMTIGEVMQICVDLDQPYSVDPNIDVLIGTNCDCDPNPPFDCYLIQPLNTSTDETGSFTGNDCDGNPFDISIPPSTEVAPICVRADGLHTKSPFVNLTNLGPCP